MTDRSAKSIGEEWMGKGTVFDGERDPRRPKALFKFVSLPFRVV